jgi:agmatinase
MINTWFDIKPPFSEYGRAKAVIIPAPYEATVTWQKGTAKGPAAVREASPHIELFDNTLQKHVYKVGIHAKNPLPLLPMEPWNAALAVKNAVVPELETARFPVVVGGEHSVALGSIMACYERFPDLTVLQLDAHADLRDEYNHEKFSHACVMRRVSELGAKFVQAGVRSMSGEEKEWLEMERREVVSARYVLDNGDWTKKIIEQITGTLYITLDLDVLDPAEMPAVGTPEPGGIRYHHIIDLVLAVMRAGVRVVGFDVVELAPIQGIRHPEFLVASLIYTMIGAFVK